MKILKINSSIVQEFNSSRAKVLTLVKLALGTLRNFLVILALDGLARLFFFVPSFKFVDRKVDVFDPLMQRRVRVLDPGIEEVRLHSEGGLLEQFNQTLLEFSAIALLAGELICFELALAIGDKSKSVENGCQRLEHVKVHRSADKNRSIPEPEGFHHVLILDKLGQNIKHELQFD